jgi:hypothetical protein
LAKLDFAALRPSPLYFEPKTLAFSEEISGAIELPLLPGERASRQCALHGRSPPSRLAAVAPPVEQAKKAAPMRIAR